MHTIRYLRKSTLLGAILLIILSACSTAGTEPLVNASSAASDFVQASDLPTAGSSTPSTSPATRTARPTLPPAQTVEPSAARLGLTLWHSFGEGSAEAAIIKTQTELAEQSNPQVSISVLSVPGDQLINKFETETAAGGGPDLLITGNETIGREARAGLLRAIDQEEALRGAALSPAALDAVRVDGKLYAVPLTLNTVAVFSNVAMIADAPGSTEALLEEAKSGTKIVLIRSVFHNYGFFGAFGGRLLDDTGRCIADQGGFAEALAYLRELKNAGAQFVASGGEAAEAFRTGQAAFTIDGSWMLGDFRAALGDQLRVAPLPAGPAGPATPLIGGTSVVINANTQYAAEAIALAVRLTDPGIQQQWTEQTGSIPANPDVALADDALGSMAASALTGVPRPQRAELDAFWQPFDAALAEVLETDVDPVEAVQAACATMNANNGK